jgi:hypothetical protein
MLLQGPANMINFTLVGISVLLSVAADTWLAFRPAEGYPAIWFLILAGGLLFLRAAYRNSKMGGAGVVVSASHAGMLILLVGGEDTTFFGGKMVPLIASYVWVLVCLILVVATLSGYVGRRKAGPAASSEESPGR